MDLFADDAKVPFSNALGFTLHAPISKGVKMFVENEYCSSDNVAPDNRRERILQLASVVVLAPLLVIVKLGLWLENLDSLLGLIGMLTMICSLPLAFVVCMIFLPVPFFVKAGTTVYIFCAWQFLRHDREQADYY